MKKKLIHYLTILSIISAGIAFFYTPIHADIIFKGDYETGTFSGLKKGFCCSYSGQVVTSPSRSGNHAARYEVRYNDPDISNNKRTETWYLDNRIGKIGGPDEWYGFSIYLPSNYELDDDPRRWQGLGTFDILAQWHAYPDAGEVWRSPPLFLVTDNGKWKFTTIYSSKPIQKSNDGTWVYLWEGPYQTGVWTDWVVHVKWSYQSDGFVEIWKDGVKIVDYKGPNAYNDKKNIYWKWGIYKPWWKNGPTHVTQRVIYNDELRIGDSNSYYAEVAPSVSDSMPPSKPILSVTATSASSR